MSSKESDFVVWETSLNQLQERMRGIEEREQQLKERVAEHKKVIIMEFAIVAFVLIWLCLFRWKMIFLMSELHKSVHAINTN